MNSKESADPFDRYQARVAALYAQAGGVSWSCEFEAAPPELCTPRELATALLEAVPAQPWLPVCEDMESSWAWRPGPPASSGTGSAAFARKIVETAHAAGLKSWTSRMPTMSGATGPHTRPRRSIDLVRHVADGHYAFIEIQTVRNDPGRAAFEGLFYGIAYCRARQQRRRPVDAAHRVLSARRIDLVVLAPRAWYACESPEGTFTVPYSLNRLTIVLNATLKILREALRVEGLDDITFGFKVFDDEAQALRDVAAGHDAGREYARGRNAA